MELHQLEYVLAVARYQSFTRAAEEINVSQSSLSIQISKLEAELAVRLFDRTTRTVILTAAGKEFLPYAQEICDSENQLKRTMSLYSLSDQGMIKIGAFSEAHFFGFGKFMGSFREKNPKVVFDIYECASPELNLMLLNNELDVAFMINPPRHDELELYPLYHDELVLAAAPQHRLAAFKSIRPHDLEGETLIFSESGTLYNDFSQLFKSKKGSPDIQFHLTHGTNALNNACLAANGFGVTLLTSRIAEGYRDTGLALIKVRPQIPRIFLMASTRQTAVRPLIKNFIAHTGRHNWG